MIYYDTQTRQFVIPGVHGGRMVKKFLDVELAEYVGGEDNPTAHHKQFVGFEAVDIPAHWLEFPDSDNRFGKHPGKRLVYVEADNGELTPDDEGYSYGDLVLEDIPAPTAEELARQAWREVKASRALLISQITVTTAAGNKFHGDEASQTRMARAVSLANGDLTKTLEWKVIVDEDGTTEWQVLPVSELKEAGELAGLEQTRIMKEAEAS